VLYAQSEKTLSIEQHTWTSVTSASRISSWFLYQQRQLCVWLAAGEVKRTVTH
jgi:cytidylate kinase